MPFKCLDPNCDTCSTDKMTCNKCNAGFVMFGLPNNDLKFCIKNDIKPCDYQECKTCSTDNLSCEACNEGSKLEDVAEMGYKVCMNICEDPNCKTCDEKDKGKCMACKPDNEFAPIPGSEDKICLKAGFCADPNCKTCVKDRFECEACNEGFRHVKIAG